MTPPRQILAHSTYLITRRCTQRQFLLKPSELTNQVVRYCYAVAAERTGVVIHALCAMSNHIHAVVSDPEARLPEFLAWAHRYIAKCLNASYGRWENLFAAEQASVVRLEGDSDVLDKIVYTLCNPVSAGLVRDGAKWPGVRTAPRELAGSETTVERPAVLFRDDGPMPKTAVLRMVRPRVLCAVTDAELATRVERLVTEREAEVRSAMKKEGRAFLGARRVLAQRITDSPHSVKPRRGLSPRVAAKNKWRRIEALRRIRAFVNEYRQAFEQVRAGVSDVVFPAGTYALRVVFGVRCHDDPTCSSNDATATPKTRALAPA